VAVVEAVTTVVVIVVAVVVIVVAVVAATVTKRRISSRILRINKNHFQTGFWKRSLVFCDSWVKCAISLPLWAN
jgi:hypothetical protein